MIDLGDIFAGLLDLATSLPPWRSLVGMVIGIAIGVVVYIAVPSETWGLPLGLAVCAAGVAAGMLWDSKAKPT